VSHRRELADQLALATVEHGSRSTAKLALIVRVRRVDVAAELAANPLFAKTGGGRGTRWSHATSASEDPRDGVRDGVGRDDTRESRAEVTRDEFDLLRRRVKVLERLFISASQS
jgi:hypothetical protein